jgi:drug/metabolite transporter (DMT)-like permease
VSRRGWIYFIALSVIWGTPYLFIAIAVQYVEPSVLVALRVSIAAAFLLPITIFRRQLLPALKHWPWVVLFALVEICVPFLMLGYAEQRLTSSLTVLIIAAVPIVAAVLTRAFGLEPRLGTPRIIGLVIGISGVGVLVGLDVDGSQLWAVLAAVIVVFGYALGPIIITTRLSDVPALGVIVWALLLATVIYAPIAWWQWPTEPVPASAWWSIIALGVLCTAIAFVFLFALVAEAGPSRTTVITFINPAIAVLLGVVILSEPLTWGIAFGFPLVILGSFLATRPDRRKAAIVEDAPHP